MAKMTEKVLLASGARTTTQTLGPYFNPDDLGNVDAVEVILDLTAFVTAASLTLSIEEMNDGSAAFRSVIAAVALTGNGVARLRVSPFLSADVTNAAKAGPMAKQWRVVVTHGNANSHTYSVSAKFLREC
jgi:hypothetical protein